MYLPIAQKYQIPRAFNPTKFKDFPAVSDSGPAVTDQTENNESFSKLKWSNQGESSNFPGNSKQK